jgi:exodeoxyribonuclease VII small subunit
MTARKRKNAGGDGASGATGPDDDSSESLESGSFEASLERLEAIVDRLEGGELPLEAALEAFETGVALTRRCASELEATERRIEVLVAEGGNWVSRPFQEAEEDA